MRDKRHAKDPHETEKERGPKRVPSKNESDRSAEEVNADQPSTRGRKPKRAPKRGEDHPGAGM